MLIDVVVAAAGDEHIADVVALTIHTIAGLDWVVDSLERAPWVVLS
jgi:hypothetical protein